MDEDMLAKSEVVAGTVRVVVMQRASSASAASYRYKASIVYTYVPA